MEIGGDELLGDVLNRAVRTHKKLKLEEGQQEHEAEVERHKEQIAALKKREEQLRDEWETLKQALNDKVVQEREVQDELIAKYYKDQRELREKFGKELDQIQCEREQCTEALRPVLNKIALRAYEKWLRNTFDNYPTHIVWYKDRDGEHEFMRLTIKTADNEEKKFLFMTDDFPPEHVTTMLYDMTLDRRPPEDASWPHDIEWRFMSVEPQYLFHA